MIYPVFMGPERFRIGKFRLNQISQAFSETSRKTAEPILQGPHYFTVAYFCLCYHSDSVFKYGIHTIT